MHHDYSHANHMKKELITYSISVLIPSLFLVLSSCFFWHSLLTPVCFQPNTFYLELFCFCRFFHDFLLYLGRGVSDVAGSPVRSPSVYLVEHYIAQEHVTHNIRHLAAFPDYPESFFNSP